MGDSVPGPEETGRTADGPSRRALLGWGGAGLEIGRAHV